LISSIRLETSKVISEFRDKKKSPEHRKQKNIIMYNQMLHLDLNKFKNITDIPDKVVFKDKEIIKKNNFSNLNESLELNSFNKNKDYDSKNENDDENKNNYDLNDSIESNNSSLNFEFINQDKQTFYDK